MDGTASGAAARRDAPLLAASGAGRIAGIERC
jgi:hypothetical protein